MDRSPCGTGTSALMATLDNARGGLPLGVEFVNESIIGTRFGGRLIREVQVHEFAAVDPNDPAKYGFVVGRNQLPAMMLLA
jgi:proline racemase